MKKLLVLLLALFLLIGCTTMTSTTGTLPTSGKKLDILGVAYNNPLTQDISVVMIFDKDGNPIYSANTGGPGIIKSTTAQTTQGTTFGAIFPRDKGDTNVVTAAPVAAGGAGGKGGIGVGLGGGVINKVNTGDAKGGTFSPGSGNIVQ